MSILVINTYAFYECFQHQTHWFGITCVCDYTAFECCMSVCFLTAGINKAEALFAIAGVIYIHKH